jgi:hypothetical protein
MQKKPERFGLLYGKKHGAELLGNNHSMSEEAWQKVKAFQIAQYYVKTDGKHTQASTQENTTTTTATNKREPLPFDD